jgi:hypothetical protein
MKKNIILTILSLLFVQGMTTSCSDWLDVDSSANVKEEVLFSEPDGFRTAVNGVYRLLSAPALYGHNLTWGVASVLGNNYDATRMPNGLLNGDSYSQLATGEYTSPYATGVVDPIWLEGYKVIANCNNVIGHMEGKDGSFFLSGETEKNMILGEMLGIRALVHFDILRLFAPSAKADDGKKYIPYVTVFPEKQPPHLTMAEVLEHIITDLERSKELLADCDTLDNASSFSSYTNRLQPVTYLPLQFFSVRGTRFNYFAASAILARAYQWRGGTGDAELAYKAARDVYRFSTSKTWYQFTPTNNMTSDENSIFRKMPHDILFALFNNNMYTVISSSLPYPGFQNLFYKNDEHLFTGDLDDFRRNLINADKTSRRWSKPTGNETGWPTADIIAYQGPLAPVVRLSEMIYIMCEHLSDVDLPQAITLLEKVRTARGAKALLGNISKADLLQKLYIEMTREFMSEGQTFYLYKRLNGPMYNGTVSVDMTGRYVLPIPHAEEAYSFL